MVPVSDPRLRLERLRAHVRRGWERVCARPTEADRARRWLAQHPSAMPAVDALWAAALERNGPLVAWLEQDADPEAWPLELPLHSVLASHPFACLSPWSSPVRSSRS
ncbi:MAG TPA: hypothetical protein VF530_15485 [Planctomycetota bacterium]